jgi:hypothetical protein
LPQTPLAKVKTRIRAASQHLQSTLWRSFAKASLDERRIIEDLRTEGVHVTMLDRLLPRAVAQAAIDQAAQLLRSSDARVKPALWSRRVASTDLDPRVMLETAPELYLLGLHPALLHLAQRYLGLPVAYHGAVLRHSLIDGEGAGPRLWHEDAEDFHVLRVVVYLSDVTEGAGPFEYIPRSRQLTYRQIGALARDELNDLRMQQVVPRAQWRRCLGSAGTVVLADSAKVFHHESLQVDTERFVIMIGYSSRHPKSMDLAMKHFPIELLRAQLIALVPPQLHPHVFGWRRAS